MKAAVEIHPMNARTFSHQIQQGHQHGLTPTYFSLTGWLNSPWWLRLTVGRVQPRRPTAGKELAAGVLLKTSAVESATAKSD